ncbi:MAG: FtsX-like permease family protein, partial [Gemmatimonadaceae bacterium]
VLLTIVSARLIERIHITVDFPVVLHLAIDSRVLAFALALALTTGIVCGLAPALHGARGNLGTALRSEGAGAGTRRQRWRNAFVVTQLAFSVLLLVAAGLFLRAFERGRAIDPGFRIDGVATANIDLTNAGYDSTRMRSFLSDLAERMRLEPGVDAVSYASTLPLSGSLRSTDVTVPGIRGTAGSISMPYATVGVDFFRVIGLPVSDGRAFLPTDGPTSPPVAVVTEAFARKLWPGRSALGRTFDIGKRSYTVVGLTRDAYLQSLQRGDQPFMFLSDEQEFEPSMILVARLHGDPSQIAAPLRSTVASLDRRLAPPDVQSFAEVTAVSLLPQRIAATVTGAFGVVGLLLAAVGLYGVIAYGVSQRTREFGIRIALGATPGMLSRLVVMDAVRPIGVGLAIGLLLAMAAARVLASLLFGVSATDPATLVVVPGTLALVALIASYVPARRAARVDATMAARQD